MDHSPNKQTRMRVYNSRLITAVLALIFTFSTYPNSLSAAISPQQDLPTTLTTIALDEMIEDSSGGGGEDCLSSAIGWADGWCAVRGCSNSEWIDIMVLQWSVCNHNQQNQER